jgi:hypothetical protein
MKQFIIFFTMKKEIIKTLKNEEKAQATVLFSVLLLLMVTVGLISLQIGQGVVTRIRFRQLADSSCLSAATAYPAQAVAIEHASLCNDYVILIAKLNTTLSILGEAATVMNSKVPGYDTLSTYLASSDFSTLLATYTDLINSISNTPQNPNLLPPDFETEARALMHLSSMHAARRNNLDNQSLYGGLFLNLEQVVLPDSFLWSDDPLNQPVHGFFQISDMPAPRFFFLNVFPYASIDRKGKMINASYTTLIDLTNQDTASTLSLKECFDQQNQSLENLNQANIIRLNSMKLIALPIDPIKLATLTSLWESMINDYQQWFQASVDLDAFRLGFSSVQYSIPSFTTLLNAQHQLGEQIQDIAESKGISISHHNTMKEELSPSLNLRDFFSPSSTESAVLAFQDRLILYYETLQQNTSVTQNSISLLLQKLDSFERDEALPNQDIPSIFQTISEAIGDQLDTTSHDKIEPMEFFLSVFSAHTQTLYEHINSISLNWNAQNSLLSLSLPLPSNVYFDDASDFFVLPYTRLESN